MRALKAESLALESLLPAAMVALFRIPTDQDPLHHLSIGQIRLMRALFAGKKAASEVGQQLGMSKSSLTQMASRLIGAGLVSKQTGSDDRRVRELDLTPTGRKLMVERRAMRAKRAEKVLERFDADKARELMCLLEEIAALDKAQADLTEVLI